MATLFSKNYVFCKFLLFLQVNRQINTKKHFFRDVILKVTLYLKKTKQEASNFKISARTTNKSMKLGIIYVFICISHSEVIIHEKT